MSCRSMVEWSQNSTLAHLCTSCYEWSSLHPVLCKLREGKAANRTEKKRTLDPQPVGTRRLAEKLVSFLTIGGHLSGPHYLDNDVLW